MLHQAEHHLHAIAVTTVVVQAWLLAERSQLILVKHFETQHSQLLKLHQTKAGFQLAFQKQKQ